MMCFKINFKSLTAALTLFTLMATASLPAQVRTQDQRSAGTEASVQDEDQMAYEEIFRNIDDTGSHNALDLLRRDENFSTFIKLLEDSGLEKSVMVQEELTIFAPTNQAFEQMRKEEYDKLKNPKNRGDLIRIINAHVVPRKMYASEFQGNQVLNIPGGENIRVETLGHTGSGALPDGIIIGGATIIRPDVETENGLVHVVNRIVRPEGLGTTYY